MTHPTQPTYEDKQGVIRFKKNAIVEFLLEKGGFDMNALARMNFNDEDRRQFAQLIGYSVDGYKDLTYTEEVKEKDFYTVGILFQRRSGNDTINTVRSFMCEGDKCKDGFDAKAEAERYFSKQDPLFFKTNSIVAWDVQSWGGRMNIFGYEITKIKEKYVFNGTEYETEFLMRAAERKENKRLTKLRLIEILCGFEHIHASLPKHNGRHTEISIIGREFLFRGERNITELAEILIDNWTEINYLIKTLEQNEKHN